MSDSCLSVRFRPTLRCSYTASDRIHSTLQKAVKDGNVLEKIKAFEMQAAAAAQAESTTKSVASSTGVNHRMQPVTTSMQSVAHRTLSPAIVHLMQHPLSPLPVPSHQQPSQSSRGRHGHSGQQRHDETRQTPQGAPAKKGAHVLEPAHGDVILKRRTPSQITVNDEDYSITAISSMALNSSKDHRRTSASRSRPKHEKRSPSKNDTQAHRQKRATTPTSKSTPRRRWLKGRKETTPEAPPQQTEKQEIPATKSKSKKVPTPKPVDPKKTSSSSKKGQAVASSDNNRHHGLTTAKEVEEEKKEAARAPLPIPDESEYHSDDEQHPLMNRYMILKHDDSSQGRREEMIIVAAPQRRSMKKPQQQKLSSTDGEILSKVDEDTRFVDRRDLHSFTGTVRLVVDSRDRPMVTPINRSWTMKSTVTGMFSLMSPSWNRNCLSHVINRFSIHRMAKPAACHNSREHCSDAMPVNALPMKSCKIDVHNERKRIPKSTGLIHWRRNHRRLPFSLERIKAIRMNRSSMMPRSPN